MAAPVEPGCKTDYLRKYLSEDSTKSTSNKEDYLKKYISGECPASHTKKKRRKKVSKSHHGCKIIDDDIDVKQLIPSEIEVRDRSETDDEDPTVHAVEDNSAFQTKFDSSQWKQIGEDNTELRKQKSSLKNTYDSSESDQSITRSTKIRHDSDSDQSAPRTTKPHYKTEQSSHRTTRKRYDSSSDLSITSTHKDNTKVKKPRMQVSRKRYDSNSDQSPPRESRESDQSPPRQSRNKCDSDNDQSPPRKVSRSERDQSPPQTKSLLSSKSTKHQTSKRYYSDNDQSLPRKVKPNHPQSTKDNLFIDSCDDQSPPREKNNTKLSPYRRHDSPNKGSNKSRWNSDRELSLKPSSDHLSDKEKGTRRGMPKEKAGKTLSGLKAGLQSAKVLRTELQQAKLREKEHLKNIAEDVLGKGAQTIFRDRSTGKLRDLKEEGLQERMKKAKEDELKAKYAQWGQGLKQRDDKEKRLQEDLHEMTKPLARYEGDEDLERHLKEKERLGDPMLEFIRKKKTEGVPSRPTYRGPPPPPNRLNIMPGYRWDGVDRSNGFEKKIFEKQSSKVALEEEAYRWSTENM